MTQGTPHTKRKHKHKPKAYEKLGFSYNQVEQAARATTEYLKEWTDRELQHLVLEQKIPVCLPIGDRGFLIGRYQMQPVGKHTWRVLDNNQEFVHDFSRKLSAVFYCLTTQLNKLNLAREILTADTAVGKLEVDQDYYMYSIKNYAKKQDFFRVDLAKLRYIQAQHELVFANQELEKTINTAKYLKVQERLL
jgi:hypothetical protein